MAKITPFVNRARRRQTQRRGFWTETPEGYMVHVQGDPNMSAETLAALMDMADLAVKQFSTSEPEQDREEENTCESST